jgi:hypothetical protein
VSDLKKADLVEVEPDIEEDDVTETRPDIARIDVIAVDMTDAT